MFRLLVSQWNQPTGEGFVRHVRGDIVDVPDEHQDRLLKAGAIEDTSAQPSRDPIGDSDTGVEEEAAPVERPLRTAPKSVWVDFAVSQGINRAEAESLTKADLVEALS